jgi:hypothetical protein
MSTAWGWFIAASILCVFCDLRQEAANMEYWQRMVTVDEHGRAILSFDTLLTLRDSDVMYTPYAPSLGSAPYVAPECNKHLKLSWSLKMTQPMDVFSFGMTMYEVRALSF